MICLRVLPSYLGAELRVEGDVLGAKEDELLVTPPCLCAKCGGSDLSRRSFFGVVSGLPTTLAYVSDEPADELFEEFYNSPVSQKLWPEGRMLQCSKHLQALSEAASVFRPGQVIRVRSNGNRTELFPAEMVELAAMG